MSDPQNQPLRRQLNLQADRMRAEYLLRGFTRDDYSRLVARADAAMESARALGVPGESLGALRRSRGVLGSVLTLLSDPAAEEVAPTNDQVYDAALRVARLSRLTGQFKASPEAWKNQVGALFGELEAEKPEAAQRLVLLEFAGLCRDVGMRIEPAGGLGAEIELDDWTMAAAPALTEGAGTLAAAARSGCEALVAMKRPGLVVIDAGSAMPDAPSLRRVGNDETGEIEMQRHVDQFIIDHHDEMAEAVDTRFAFAAVIGAVLHSVNVSAGRVNFAGCYRVVNLCEPTDVRMPRLRRFMDLFSKAVCQVR